MKASQRNPADLLMAALLSVGALSLGLLSLGRFDLISEPFGSLIALSRGITSATALVVFYKEMTRRNLQQHVRVRV